jgi:hypothetical protein
MSLAPFRSELNDFEVGIMPSCDGFRQVLNTDALINATKVML